MSLLLLFVALLPIAFCNHRPLSSYEFNATLMQDRYWLYWSFDKTTENIFFAVKARTNGWIGFGLSPNGQMPGSDVIIGWIDGNTPYFHDRYASGRSLPPIDSKQNWNLTESEQSDGYTVLQFHRSFKTCDDSDLDIQYETAHVIYSFNDEKPVVTTNSDGTQTYSISPHTVKGAKDINLLGGLTNPPRSPNNTHTFTVGVHNARLSDDDTVYWCEATRLSLSTEKYVIKFSPKITPGNEQYVHHILIYICNGLLDSDIGPEAGGNCIDGTVNNRITSCSRQLLLAAWSVGGSDFIYPANVAFPVGGPNNPQFAVVEIHYNNPSRVPDIIDSSGITFTYIDERREHNAGILYVGHDVDYKMILPPNAPNFTVTSICSDTCTKKLFPPGGIHIFANMLHTHVLGTGLVLRHIRQTTCSTGASRYEELKPVEKNLHFDFNFQQTNHLPQEITVLPGDIFILNCRYNTTAKTGVTMGGLSTLDEMCLSFPVYYPRLESEICYSSPTFKGFDKFIEKYIPKEHQQTFEGIKFDRVAQLPLKDAMNSLNWTTDQVAAFQEIVYSTGEHNIYCPMSHINNTPSICCSYETENTCTGYTPAPCCSRNCLNDRNIESPSGATCVHMCILLVITFALLAITF